MQSGQVEIRVFGERKLLSRVGPRIGCYSYQAETETLTLTLLIGYNATVLTLKIVRIPFDPPSSRLAIIDTLVFPQVHYQSRIHLRILDATCRQ
jgi:hypothetical protein